jgi:hypothetical protein
MKMLLKSNKGSGNFPPLQNIINDQHLEEFDYDDYEKCDLLKKRIIYLLISKFSFAIFFKLLTLFLCFLFLQISEVI